MEGDHNRIRAKTVGKPKAKVQRRTEKERSYVRRINERRDH